MHLWETGQVVYECIDKFNFLFNSLDSAKTYTVLV